MAGKLAANRDKEMAAYLRSKGIFHGCRISFTAATHNYPRANDAPGSARMQRSSAQRRAGAVGTRDPKGLVGGPYAGRPIRPRLFETEELARLGLA